MITAGNRTMPIGNASIKPIQAKEMSIFYCGQEACDPGHTFGPAIRPHYLIHYVIRGKGIYYEKKRIHQLSGGDAFLILPWESTVYTADENDPWEYAWFSFDGPEIPAILHRCGISENQLILHTNDETIQQCMQELLTSFLLKSRNEYLDKSCLYRFFSYFLLNEESELSKTADHIERAIQYIQHNYAHPIGIQDIANYLHIDRTYLYKLFSQYQNISPQYFLIRYRLSIACRLLTETDMTVNAVACSCGFADSPSFIKQFKKHYRTTPSLFRKSGALQHFMTESNDHRTN